jgi:hypothetical protein
MFLMNKQFFVEAPDFCCREPFGSYREAKAFALTVARTLQAAASKPFSVLIYCR